jgi:Domain of unknown function (DUF4037)
MARFLSGLELSQRFFHEVAKPLLEAQFPDLGYSAALIGWGSEVLGYDNQQSTDHHWGPRFLLFLTPDDFRALQSRISQVFSAHLPYTFCGYSTHFDSPDGDQVRLPRAIASGPVNHLIHLDSTEYFFRWYLGIDPFQALETTAWLSLSEHKLLSVTRGAVFHDGLGELEPVRQRLAYYPHDVWLYLLACQWQKVAEEEAFVGRCSAVGDELGSRLIAGRLVYTLIKLCFLLEKTYAPYSKWLGTAFRSLQCASELAPILMQVVQATSYREREDHLAQAYTIVARLHNRLGVSDPVDDQVSPYHQRPYLVIHAENFAHSLWDQIQDESLKRLRFKGGSINQWVNSDEQISNAWFCQQLKPLYS